MATRIYTKTGDGGTTGLVGGERVSKAHLRVAAYGDVDELNAGLGMVRAATPPPELDGALGHLQLLLFELGAQLATPPSSSFQVGGVRAEDVSWLEQEIDAHEAALEPLKTFILPGGTPAASALHVARTVCRRAERAVVLLTESGASVAPEAVQFLNRLADLLFVLARRANRLAGVPDVPWHARDKAPST